MVEYHGTCVIELNVNGSVCSVTARPCDTLLDVLRNECGLTGAKPGCKNGDCGACTVMLDGWPVKSCLVLAVEAVGHEILTVEGLQNAPIQQAFIDAAAFQCGYCTSGFLMVCHALHGIHPDADEYTVEEWLQSNICRCTSYAELRDAVERVFPNAHSIRA